MNGKPCASSLKAQDWDSIDWNNARAYVKKLQLRIVKAQKEGHYSKLKALQWLLTHYYNMFGWEPSIQLGFFPSLA